MRRPKPISARSTSRGFRCSSPRSASFFLEGAGVFDVAGLINTTDLRPFFSRRVGLIDNVAVPVRLGVKLTGRQSDYNIGVLDVETGALADAGLPGGAVDRQNLLVARVSRNLFQQSWVGGILTHGDPSGSGGNTLIGGDARFATSTFHGNKNLSLDLFLLGTEDECDAARATAPADSGSTTRTIDGTWRSIGGRSASSSGRRWASFRAPGSERRMCRSRFSHGPNAGASGSSSSKRIQWSITNLQNRLESWSVFTAPFNVRTESGEHLEWNYIPTFEHLDQPFEIFPGVVIPPGSYRWTQIPRRGQHRHEAAMGDRRGMVVGWFLPGNVGADRVRRDPEAQPAYRRVRPSRAK